MAMAMAIPLYHRRTRRYSPSPIKGKPNPDEGVVHEIENPNPAKGTNNWYAEDGYGGGGFGSPVSGGGSYSDCSDTTQPGVGPVVSYLKGLGVDPRCEPGHYYLLNNYNPGYFGNSKNAYIDQNPANTPFTIPPYFNAQHRRRPQR